MGQSGPGGNGNKEQLLIRQRIGALPSDDQMSYPGYSLLG